MKIPKNENMEHSRGAIGWFWKIRETGEKEKKSYDDYEKRDGAKGGNSGWLFLLCNLQRESHFGETPSFEREKNGKKAKSEREKEKKV